MMEATERSSIGITDNLGGLAVNILALAYPGRYIRDDC